MKFISQLSMVIFLCFFTFSVSAAERLSIELKKQLLLKQYSRAIPALEALAIKGNNEARYQLALCNLNGGGSNPSVFKAVKLLRAASNKGHAKASYLLGSMYYKGDLIGQDISAAKSYLFIAEQKGHRLAKKLSRKIDDSNQQRTVSITDAQLRLEYAARTGDKLQAEDALSNGANINKKNTHGNTILIIASRNKQFQFIPWLLTKKPFLSTVDKNKDSALHFISLYGKTQLVKKMILSGAPLNIQNSNGRTPLINAVISGQSDLVTVLLENGANPQLKDRKNKSAFDYAENNSNPKLILILKPYRTDSEEYEKLQQKLKQLHRQAQQQDNLYFEWPVLAIAVAQHQSKLVKLLLNRGADPWKRSSTGVSAISLAAFNDKNNYSPDLLKKTMTRSEKQQEQSLELLVVAAKKNNVNFIRQFSKKLSPKSPNQTDFIKTPLWHAIENSSTDAALQLISWQQSDFRTDKKGRNFLHLATRQNLPKVVTALIKKGFGINRTDSSERSAFWYAADGGYQDMMVLLYTKHANIHQSDNEGYTPLHRAVLSGYAECVKAAINYGAVVNQKTTNGNTALFFAASSSPNIVNILIHNGANISERNHLTYTPLMIAVKNKCMSCIKQLITAEANPSRRTSKGKNSFDMAEGNQLILNLLEPLN